MAQRPAQHYPKVAPKAQLSLETFIPERGRVDDGAANGFRHSNHILEEYLTKTSGTLRGNGLKPSFKAAARSAVSEYLETAGKLRHKQVLKSQLEGAGINGQIIEEILA